MRSAAGAPLTAAGGAVMALGLGTILRPCPSWFAVMCFAVGGLCIAFEVVAAVIARRRAAKAQEPPAWAGTPEQIGETLYGLTKRPLTVTITLTMPPEKREVFMRLASKRRGGTSEEWFARAVGPIVIRAVDDYLERHE